MTRMTASASRPWPDRGPRRQRLREWSLQRPWIWSYLAAFATWVAVSAIAGKGFAGTLTSTLALVPFLVLTGIGQMVVITLGNGNIDLSLANTLTLTAYVSTGVMNGGKGSIAVGFLVALGIGVLIGAINSFVILALRVPPIVATLSVGLIVQSAVLVYSGTASAVPDPGLVAFTPRPHRRPVAARPTLHRRRGRGGVRVVPYLVRTFGSGHRAETAGGPADRPAGQHGDRGQLCHRGSIRGPGRCAAGRLQHTEPGSGLALLAQPRSPSWCSAARSSPAAGRT